MDVLCRMSKLSKSQWQELREHYERSFGYGCECPILEKIQTHLRIEFTHCGQCGRMVGGAKLWWEKVSYFENEWECYCSRCALNRIHQFDGFEEEWALSEMK